MKKSNNFVSFLKEKPIYGLVVLLFGASAFIPYFLTGPNLLNIMKQSSDLIIISCGLTFVLLNGGIDFSVSAVLGCSSIVGAYLMNLDNGLMKNSPLNVPVTILVMILVGLVIGAINGFAVTKLKMPSFMATIATNFIFGGLALGLANSNPVSNLPDSFKFIGNGNIAGIPMPFIIAIVVMAALQFVLFKTLFGKWVYAVGTNQRASRVTGIPVKKTVLGIFLLSSGIVTIGSMISTARMGVGMPALGVERFVDFISAAVLGGTSIYGGAGSIVGTFVGAIFVSVLANALGMLGVPWYYITVSKGAIVLIIALVNSIKYMGKKD